ncbi:NAD kinase 2, mitochondrial-like [Prorops nasuta]|uniref:NAD kinase 2, mitochondrial-like n=1 Tax=Prorops nasuta TaxID=863751 RepID=UPI0034CF05C9
MTTLSYLQRKTVRTLHLLQLSQHIHKDIQIFYRNESSFVPKKVLIVAKTSRYYMERLREPELSEDLFKHKLIARGSDYDALFAGHMITKDVETRLVNTLKKMNIEYRVVNRCSLNKASFAWADLIVPVGGDGTFLLASNLINDNKKPIVGINSYPKRSEGFLMLPPKYTTDLSSIFEMLKAGEYSILMRSRIRTTLTGEGVWCEPFHMHEKGRVAGSGSWNEGINMVPDKKGALPKTRILPWLALNEVFMGESLSARTSSLIIKLDDDDRAHKIKSSGLCLSTGTGSTSWYRAINSLSTQTVEELLHLIDKNKTFKKDEVERICSEFNKNLQIKPDDDRLCYAIRDLIVTDVWPAPKYINTRGFCKRMTVISQCFDAGLVIDGGIAVPFNVGITAKLEYFPEDSLRTINLAD